MDNLMKEEREIFKGAANMQYQKVQQVYWDITREDI